MRKFLDEFSVAHFNYMKLYKKSYFSLLPIEIITELFNKSENIYYTRSSFKDACNLTAPIDAVLGIPMSIFNTKENPETRIWINHECDCNN